MTRTLPDTIRDLCLSLPGTSETSNHGNPDFKVSGKTFAYFLVNHHGDGRVALWLNSPPGVQKLYTELDPDAYFVPPYVGPRGYLGVKLNSPLDWRHVLARVREAYEHVAPRELAERLPEILEVTAPGRAMTPEEIDPLLGQRPQEILQGLAERCSRLPESHRGSQFGAPVWKAGKKTYVCAHHGSGRLKLQFWVGVEQQPFLVADPRYSIPKYIGHNGWIDLDVHEGIHWEEVDALLLNSYRHFALKRMLKALDERSGT